MGDEQHRPRLEGKSAKKDITPILEGWDYEPDEVCVRIIRGRGATEKIQVRIDLGLIQMEMNGRPDGTRPQGFESLLDYHEARVAWGDVAEDFELTGDELDALAREGVQYYHRYLALFQLERFDLVERDTARNLRLFEFVREHVSQDRDRWRLDQYRPYVTMVNTRARAMMAINRKDYPEAIRLIDEGLAAIRRFLADWDAQDREEECIELQVLIRLREELDRSRPVSTLEKLQKQLRRAVQSENFERAAELRDRIRAMEAAE